MSNLRRIRSTQYFYRYLLFSILASSFISCASYKLPPTKYYIDVDGTEIGEKEFDFKWRNHNPKYAGVKYIAQDSGMVFKLSHLTYETYKIKYKPFHETMEEITGKKLPDSTTFILDYTFKDDYCTNQPPNQWSKSRLSHRYNYITKQIKLAEKEFQNLVYSKHFERGIELPEFSEKQKEIFFLDSSGFFRQKIFRNPSLCGSYAIVRPNGEMLIRNGEYGVLGMIEHLRPENWDLFFPDKP